MISRSLIAAILLFRNMNFMQKRNQYVEETRRAEQIRVSGVYVCALRPTAIRPVGECDLFWCDCPMWLPLSQSVILSHSFPLVHRIVFFSPLSTVLWFKNKSKIASGSPKAQRQKIEIIACVDRKDRTSTRNSEKKNHMCWKWEARQRSERGREREIEILLFCFGFGNFFFLRFGSRNASVIVKSKVEVTRERTNNKNTQTTFISVCLFLSVLNFKNNRTPQYARYNRLRARVRSLAPAAKRLFSCFGFFFFGSTWFTQLNFIDFFFFYNFYISTKWCCQTTHCSTLDSFDTLKPHDHRNFIIKNEKKKIGTKYGRKFSENTKIRKKNIKLKRKTPHTRNQKKKFTWTKIKYYLSNCIHTHRRIHNERNENVEVALRPVHSGGVLCCVYRVFHIFDISLFHVYIFFVFFFLGANPSAHGWSHTCVHSHSQRWRKPKYKYGRMWMNALQNWRHVSSHTWMGYSSRRQSRSHSHRLAHTHTHIH